MRRWFAIALVLGLAACSSGQGASPLTKAIYAKVTTTIGIGDEPEPTAPPRQMTRADIEKSGLAMLRAKVGEGTQPQTLVAQTDNGGYVTFASQLRQSLTLKGALVTATRGIERDLLSTQVFPGDPVAFLTPVENWPESVRRVYYLPGNSPEGEKVEVICSFLKGDVGEHTIVQVTYPVVQMLESCQGDGFGFENAHLVDTRTGAIWRTRQWIGFQSAYVLIDVLEPYTE
jgi:Group 4 capsule polysaccharide lipoprotein gfcB, YjbF